MVSFSLFLYMMDLILKLLNSRSWFASKETVHKKLLKSPLYYKSERLKSLPRYIKKWPHTIFHVKENWSIVTFDHKGSDTSSNDDIILKIVYFHGGAFVMGISFMHWIFLDRLMGYLAKKGVSFRIIVPLYPRCPEATHRDLYDNVEAMSHLQQNLIATNGTKQQHIVYMGDSAGANIALSLSLFASPAKVDVAVLITPWLDLSLENPLIDEAKSASDPILAKDGLRYCGEMWAGGDNLQKQHLSPLHATKIPDHLQIHLFIAGKDILGPDAELFAQKFSKHNNNKANISSYLYKDMWHAWILIPWFVSQGTKARMEIFSIIDKLLER